MSDLRWNLSYKGSTYEFDASRDLRVGTLRQFKGWMGPDYGKFWTFLGLLAQGDADACACALWVTLKNAGEKVPSNPTFLDFEVGEFLAEPEETEEAKGEDEDPTPPSGKGKNRD